MRATGLDSRYSWKITLFCGLVYMFSTAPLRVTGLIFVGLIEDLDVSRQQAAWPLTMHYIFFQIAAPLATVFCKFWSHEQILRWSCFIGSIAVSLCFFCPLDVSLWLLFGIIQGTALSQIFVTASVIQAKHFEKKQATAQGISATLSSVSMFLAPWAFRWALEKYRLRGSLLLLGAATLNAFAATFAISKPVREDESVLTEEMAEKIIETSCIATRHPICASAPLRGRLSSLHSVLDDFSPPVTCIRVDNSAVAAAPNIVVSDPEGRKSIVEVEEAPVQKEFLRRLSERVGYILGIRFLIDVTSFALVYQCLSTFMLLVVDYIQGLDDVDFDKSQIATLTFSIYCIGDLSLRATAGMLIDGGLISTEGVMAAGFWIQAIALFFFMWARSAWAILFICFLLGTSNGSRIFLFPVVIIADFGIGTLTDSTGIGNFVNGLISLWRPLLIGYFRDIHGDYTGLFVLLAALNIPFAIYWTNRWIKSKGTIRCYSC